MCCWILFASILLRIFASIFICTQQRSTAIHKATANSYKGDIESNTIIMGDCNTPLTSMDRSSRQKISKETQVLNDTLDQKDLIDIYRTFHSKAAEYIFFSSAHGTFSRIDHILGHRASLSKFKKIKITSSIFSDHNTIGLEINYKKRNCKKRKHKPTKPNK